MRVLVTGAFGFVGRHLVPRLRADGHDVVPRGRDVDVTDAARVDAEVASVAPDAIVHLAALSSPKASWDAPQQSYRVNYLGTRSILRAARLRAPRARVLWIGSAAEYGSAPSGSAPLTEETPLRPASPYATAKASADLLAASYAARGLDVVRVRAFNHAGPGQSEAFVIASFARQVTEIATRRREPRLRVGNLDSVRDFLDIHDVVDAYRRLLEPAVPAGVYNVASGAGVRVRDLLERLLAAAGVRAEIEVDRQRLRPTDHLVGDAGRLCDTTGWSPQIPLERTLDDVLSDWRARVDAA